MAETPWPDDDFSRGDLLAKRYRVTDFLGHGGMGLVYAALDVTTGTPVAVKMPRREFRNRKKALARFQQESRAAARLRGPNVARVTDVAELADGTPFIVMELLVGNDLATELERRGALPLGEAVGYVLQAASGVAEAHAAGIVHRDLKPHNLFLVGSLDVRRGPDPAGGRIVKVLDFGISKIGGADAPRVTTTNARLGTPLYVSPEQLVSAKYVDARSDIWSLGVILYELLTGTRPFEGATAMVVATAIQSVEPPPPSARLAGIPPELDRIVMKALSKHAAARYASVSEFSSALAPFGAGARVGDDATVAPPSRVEAIRAPEGFAPLAAGETLADTPREESVLAESPPEAAGTAGGSTSAAERETGPSRLLLVLAALFGLALLAIALMVR
ncbi:MAG TPA: serine/threonine-protein kinase [Polyangiaceae bacterium]